MATHPESRSAFAWYALAPVPLGVFGAIVARVAFGDPVRLGELASGALLALLVGYPCLGPSSLVFAWIMTWMDRRSCPLALRMAAAALLAALLVMPSFLLFGPAVLRICALAAGVGPATVLLAFVAKGDTRVGTPRVLASRLFAVALLASLGSGLHCWWLVEARQAVLSRVTVGMTVGDVVQLGGLPAHDTRLDEPGATAIEEFALVFHRQDPGGESPLVVVVEFEKQRVVRVSRIPSSR